MVECRAARWVPSWDPTGDGPYVRARRLRLDGDFVTGQMFFDSRSAPPFGLEQRLTSTLLDDPWGAVGRTNPYPVPVGGADYPYNAALYSLFISMPYNIKTTRNHSWNVAIQHQIGENMAVSATYLGNHMVNMWGVVDGNPGVIPAGATPTGPCTLKLPAGGTQTFANCSTASARSPPRVEPAESGSRAVLRIPRLDYRCGLAELPRTDAAVPAPVGARHHDQRQLHDLDVRRLDQPGPGAAQRRHRVHETRVADQSALRRRSDRRSSTRTRGGAARGASTSSTSVRASRRRRSAARPCVRSHPGWRLSRGSSARIPVAR